MTPATKIKRRIAAFTAGILFGAGLIIGGMTQPAKVFGFLDFTGQWDPSLAFVMGGGLVVYTLAFRFIMKRPVPLLADMFSVPERRDITARLVLGSALFGIGWSLAGYCPGPGITSLGAGTESAMIFVPAMVMGMVLEGMLEHWTGAVRLDSDGPGVMDSDSVEPASGLV